MRPYSISPPTAEALRRLASEPECFWDRVRSRPGSIRCGLILQIRRADELASVPALSAYLAASGPIADLVADAIEELLIDRSSHQLQRLDEQCRQFSEYSPTVLPSTRARKTTSRHDRTARQRRYAE